jgi:hypothetical protein
MRLLVVAFSYFGVLLLVVITHLAGLWSYPSLPQPTGGSSGESTESTGGATTNGGSTTEAAETTDSQEEEPSGSSPATSKEPPPIVTAGGYTVGARCALWSVGGFDLYYYPIDPAAVCVQPPGSSVQAGTRPASTAEIPPNCAVAPDAVVYCIIGGRLSAETLRLFYNRGELETPRVTS